VKPRGAPLALAVGGVVAAVAAGIAWLLVQPDIEAKWEAGFAGRREFMFMAFCAVFAGGAAYALVRRMTHGPELAREEWTLNLADLGGRAVSDLERGLERYGYQPAIVMVSEAGAPSGPTHPTQPLSGARLGVTDRRYLVAGAGLTLLLPRPETDARRPALGMLTIVDRDPNEGMYAEMAQYLIAAMGELIPELRFKRLMSGMKPDPAAGLAATLPPRPRHLPKA